MKEINFKLILYIFNLIFFINCGNENLKSDFANFFLVKLAIEEFNNTQKPKCNSSQTTNTPQVNLFKVKIKQGIWGEVIFMEGNFMPSTGCNNSRATIQRVNRKINAFNYTLGSEVETLENNPTFYTKINSIFVKEFESNSNGFFETELEIGKYSIFVKEELNGKIYYYANGFDGTGGINPVEIKKDNIFKFNININYLASY